MLIKLKPFILSLLIPLGVGGLSAFLTRDGMATFEQMAKPPLSPPGWLFPVVWTLLYLLMGIASYRVYSAKADPEAIRRALTIYALQLGVNFFWSILFFGFGLTLIAFFWLLLLWVLIAVTALRFARIDRIAGILLLPYLLWVTFAGYLNLGIVLLN